MGGLWETSKVNKCCLTVKTVIYYRHGKTIELKAALSLLLFDGGTNPPDGRKEGDANVCYIC